LSTRDVAFVTFCHSRRRFTAAISGLCNKNTLLGQNGVTNCDARDKPTRQLAFNVCRMKTKAIYLTTTLLLTTSPLVYGDSAALSTTDSLALRYAEPGGNATLSVIQDISTGEHDSFAGRVFSFELELNNKPGEIAVKVNKAKASYTAHEMTQRLPTTTVVGQSFTLTTDDDGRTVKQPEQAQDLEIGVGQIIGGDYPVGLAVADILPILPDGPVSIGSAWITTQDTRSLEGWAWASGELNSQHSVTAIDVVDGHSIVSVVSTAQTQLGKSGEGLVYSGEGELKRTSNWRFDATAGRLLSLSMEQNTSGINAMPQGEIDVRQSTKVEYAASE
jgi:hypothetical protein